tara:strand:- start:13733 stop:14641 length:909 start_codon:yes stop_codon:yes gene_type:complete
MNRFIYLLTFVGFLINTTYGQMSKKQMDYSAIKSMCGCYNVEFNFAETFNYSKDSLYEASKVKNDKALEWVQVVEDSPSKISLQHILIIGDSANHYIVKHWRQDWLYENKDFMMYNYDNNWTYIEKTPIDVAGQWTQKVFQVDDSPRYEGSATWVHVDGKSYWENETSAPLPRREYTKRSDYNVTLRRNRHEITQLGWIHDQDNDKIIRSEEGVDLILAKEKGFNSYTKIDDSKCVYGQEWWNENKDKWAVIREVWDEVYTSCEDLYLKQEVDGVRLYQELFGLEKNIKKSKVKKKLKPYIQ